MNTSSSSLLTDKSTAPIPSIHALVASEMRLREAWRADSEKYRHTTPRTSQDTLQAWWAWTRALWTEASEGDSTNG